MFKSSHKEFEFTRYELNPFPESQRVCSGVRIGVEVPFVIARRVLRIVLSGHRSNECKSALDAVHVSGFLLLSKHALVGSMTCEDRGTQKPNVLT